MFLRVPSTSRANGLAVDVSSASQQCTTTTNERSKSGEEGSNIQNAMAKAGLSCLFSVFSVLSWGWVMVEVWEEKERGIGVFKGAQQQQPVLTPDFKQPNASPRSREHDVLVFFFRYVSHSSMHSKRSNYHR